MQVNICPPFLHGTKVTSRLPGQLEMTVVVRGVFRLAPVTTGGTPVPPGEPVAPLDDFAERALEGDLFHDGDDDRTGALVHASDFADFKLKTDVLLRGTCHPFAINPGEARAVPVCTVRFAVGSWSKSLRVFGRRVWTERAFDPISEPSPFTSMPITYENAFGGPELPQNPVGKGYKTAELPTVEDPGALIRGRRDAPEPAGFGPLSPNWPQRSGKVGKDYGKEWKKTRAPFYAADFDWSHFNSAPADQQLPGYLRGDEPLLFEYLHPKAIRFTASLPGLRPRVLCRRADGFTTEVTMNLDTLLADLDGERLVLLWRGLAKVNDAELDDVRTLLLGCEPLAAPKPAEHWLAELDAFDKDPIAYLRDQLVPEKTRRQIEDVQALVAKARAEEKERAAKTANAPGVDAKADPGAFVEGLLAAHAPGVPADQRADLLGKIKAFLQDSKAKAPELRAQAAASPAPVPTSAGMLDAFAKVLAQQRAAAAGRGISTERIEAAEQQLAKAKEQLAAMAASGKSPTAQADALATAAMSAPGGTSAPPGEAAGGGSPGPAVPAGGIPEEVGGRKNLMGRDLSGQDLSGQDLHGALLRGAKLKGAKLAGANLAGADMGEVDLEGADLAGADLTGTVLSGARAPGAVFDGATVARTIFHGADLTGASLSGARGAMVVFQETKLAKAKLDGVRFHKAAFAKALLDDADFSGAELDLCIFLEASAARALFSGARMHKTAFIRCAMPSASFVEASGEGCSWQGSTLDDADFRYAKLPRAQLNKASLLRAKLYASDFKGGRFERASLAEADFGKANLMSVSFNKAKLAATDFSGASLYDAKFLGTVASRKCNFDGANLTLAVWEQP